MGTVANVLAWLEATPENRMNTERVEIVGRDNAPSRDFGMVTNIQGAAGDASDESVLAERAVLAQVEEVWPGEPVNSLALHCSSNREQPFLMCDRGVRAE